MLVTSPRATLLTVFAAQQKRRESQSREGRIQTCSKPSRHLRAWPYNRRQLSRSYDRTQRGSFSFSQAQQSHQPAPPKCPHHLCVRTPAQNFAGADGSGVGALELSAVKAPRDVDQVRHCLLASVSHPCFLAFSQWVRRNCSNCGKQ